MPAKQAHRIEHDIASRTNKFGKMNALNVIFSELNSARQSVKNEVRYTFTGVSVNETVLQIQKPPQILPEFSIAREFSLSHKPIHF